MMTWTQAVAEMRAGNTVRRYADAWMKETGDQEVEIQNDDGDEFILAGPIIECGMEGIFLAAAWTDDDKPVMVFMGVTSRAPFIPTREMIEATDWLVDPECRVL